MSVIKVLPSFGELLLRKTKNNNVVERVDFIKRNNLYKFRINDAGETLIHEAAKLGDVEMTKAMIETGSDVNSQDYSGRTPIMLVIENEPPECLQMIKILYEANANLYIANKQGKNAIELVINNSVYRRESVQKFFLDVIHRECMNNSEMTAKRLIDLQYPLPQAVLLRNAEVIEHMIRHGIPVDSCHPELKMTALTQAIELMDLEIVKVLIKYGADVDFCDRDDFHPIFYYDTCTPDSIQQPEIIEILLRNSVLLKDVYQECIGFQFKKVFECGNKEVIQMLLKHHSDILNMRDVEDQTPLHYLSGNYHSDITELLLIQTIDVNVRDAAGRTPLYTATEYPHTHINTFQFLLENGADVNAKTIFVYDLDVPLFSLCRNNSITKDTYFKIVEMFLKYDLNVQYIGLNEETVFDIIMKEQSFYMAEPLLAHLALLDELKKPIVECIRNKIYSHKVFKNCFDVCKAQLAKMKDYHIHTKLTLYMIIVNETREKLILKSCRCSPNSLSKFDELKKEFHSNYYYYNVVQKRISSIISKLELLQTSASILSKLIKFGNNPNHLVVSEILDYLDTEDLQNLVEV